MNSKRLALDIGFEVRGFNRPFAVRVFFAFEPSFAKELANSKRRTFEYFGGLTGLKRH